MNTDTKPKPETETLDRLFVELSQFTTARTARELGTDKRIAEIRNATLELSWEIERMPASPAQTKISEMAASIGCGLNALLP